MLTFEREYFERPVYGPDTQCVMDLMTGKITIAEVPFAYRGKREFNCAFQYTKSLPHAQAEIERELIRKQMLDDIAECRRRLLWLTYFWRKTLTNPSIRRRPWLISKG